MTLFTTLVSFLTCREWWRRIEAAGSCPPKSELSFSYGVFPPIYKSTCTVNLLLIKHQHQMDASVPISRLFHLEWSSVSKLKLHCPECPLFYTWCFSFWGYFLYLSFAQKLHFTVSYLYKHLNCLLKWTVLSSLYMFINCYFLLCAFAHSASITGKPFSAPPTSTVPLNSSFSMKWFLLSSDESDTPNPPSLYVQNIAPIFLVFIHFYLIWNDV